MSISNPSPRVATTLPAAPIPVVELTDVSVMIGGQGGDGTLTVSDLLGRYFRTQGLHIYTSRTVLSRIRGGHADASVRASQEPVAAVKSNVDLILAFDKEAAEIGRAELSPDGWILYDSSVFQLDDPRAVGFPFATLVGGAIGQPIYKNTAAYGAISVLMGFDPAQTRKVIEDRFQRRGGEALTKNLRALELGQAAAREAGITPRWKIHPGSAHDLILTTGNQAVALGFVVGGGRFFAGYPITPATEVMEYLMRYLPAFHGVVRQAEDELAAINMVIGAAYAGARAMTSTSGPGLSLMTEGIGHAGAAEIPLVVVDCQRVGPSTGQPTRHEQSDLTHLVHLGHGEFPRFILAPESPEDAFVLAATAPNLAERWRLPVILLMDQALSQNTITSPRFDPAKVTIDRSGLWTAEELAQQPEYRTYQLSETGRSRYMPPGTPGIWGEVTGNEHDEWGHVSVQPGNRRAMMAKRMGKLIHARSELPPGRLYGPSTARVGLLGFGSTGGPVREAQALLANRGIATRHLQLRTLWPLPAHEIAPFLDSVDRVHVVEHNYTGQLAALVREVLPQYHAKLRSLVKYDGFTFRAPEIVRSVEEGK